MKIYKGYQEIKETFSNTVLTIGNFDGLHLGHREIIGSVIDRAKAEKGTSIVYTFRPHPQQVLSPSRPHQMINTFDEKLDLLKSLGVDVVIEEPFSREFSTISPEKFFRELLVKKISAKAIYVGYDFGFGKDREGSLEMLQKLCKQEGVECHVIAPHKISGQTCSSSKIREHILAGEIKQANALLSREFFYRGVVVKGNGRGRTIGFATANVHTESQLWVKEGVYVTRTVCRGKAYKSVTNVGRQPTFHDDMTGIPIVVETHIFDFNEDIYGETLEVRMVDRLRDEMKFSSVDTLVAQIRKDVAKAKEILK